MAMFHFKTRKPKGLTDFSALKTDIHSHLIPGIDDGSQDMETSLLLLQKLQELGYKKVITTPHVKNEIFPNDVNKLEELADKLREAATERGLTIAIEIGAEHLVDEDFHKRINEGLFKTFGDNYLLIELPFMYAPLSLGEYLFDLQCKNYKVILAHPERYIYWADDKQKFVELKERGIIFQSNINSFTGYYGRREYNLAKWFAQNNMIEILGSDTHGTRHIDVLHKALSSPMLVELINSGKIINNRF
jgi:tyrosine-protein phosphatase YwqE